MKNKENTKERERSVEIRTSTTHPIRVDWLPVSLPGRIGLTFAPGKKSWSKYTGGRWERDLDADLQRLQSHFQMDSLVSLIENEELGRYEIDGLFARCEALGIAVTHFPIRDVSTPRIGADVATLVRDILQQANQGKIVVIHCIGGLGRTGTIAGCLLAELGVQPADALQTLRKLRGPNCPETERQRAFIQNYWGSRWSA